MALYRYPLDLEIRGGNRPCLLFRNTKSEDCVFTYMPQGMQFDDSGAYGTVDGGVMGTMAKQAIAARDNEEGLAKLKQQQQDSAMANADAFGDNKPAAVAALIAGMGQSFGIDGGVLGAAAAEGGVAMNPNTVVQFQNNAIRTYQFEIQMVPESEAETISIKKIISTFKYSIYAQKEGNFLLKYPDTWRIYFGAEGSMPIQSGEVYLTSMQTKYNTAGTLVHKGFAFNEATISLSFQETKPLHRQEIKDLESKYIID